MATAGENKDLGENFHGGFLRPPAVGLDFFLQYQLLTPLKKKI